ncbi:MAG: hypothetical protein ACXVCY_04150 [Pseudobdellovibrionaceae bacterium]
MAKIETEKIIPFRFHSKMRDVGVYEGNFLVKRSTLKLDTSFIRTKAALTGNSLPVTREERILIDAIACCAVFIEPVDQYGKPLNNPGWIDEILDREIVLALHAEWIDYQNSFYEQPDVKKDENEGQTSV